MLKNINYNNVFQIWLISLIILVGLIIVVGGLTRLTDSGLSITEWELFKGILPPTTSQEWAQYFETYKKIPQYILLNNDMTLAEFQHIFLWEYAHRLLARFIGLFFLIPFIFFIFINLLSKSTTIQLTKIFFLIVVQGIIGWFMVTSGLVENTSVSHYRLSVHLIMAFTILSFLFWILLNFFYNTKKKIFNFKENTSPIKILLIFIYIQIILGAFVSGLDAGKIYQTWPLMNSSYFPDDASFNNFFNLDHPSIVQFLHRNVAYIIFFITIYLGYRVFMKRNVKLYNNFLLFFFVILIQIILGISVLVSGANIYFASMHQISTIFLVLTALSLYHRSI